MKWADAISILSLALSGGIFVLLGTGLTNAKDSSASQTVVIDADGKAALLDTLLPAGEVGLIVSAESRQEQNIVADGGDIVSVDSVLAKPKPKTSTTSKSASPSRPSKSSASTKSTTKTTTPKATTKPSETASSNPAETPCININDAAEPDLITIKGIGPATAAKIIEYRNQKGKFRKKEDILNVKGIGPAKFAQIESRICL